jgi:hypothetical protein
VIKHRICIHVCGIDGYGIRCRPQRRNLALTITLIPFLQIA